MVDDAGASDGLHEGPGHSPGPVQRLRRATRRQQEADRQTDRLSERLAHQFSAQWSQVRADRRHADPDPVPTGPSNYSRAQVPYGVDLAASWAWRVLLIGGLVYAVWRLLTYFAVITLPVVVALLISALVGPLVSRLSRLGIPRGLSAGLVVLGGLAIVALLLTFVGQQIANGASELGTQVVGGLDEVKRWLRDGPLDASDSQINDAIASAQKAITDRSKNIAYVKGVTELGSALTHVLAALFIVLFSTYFFLADGARIWAWVVRLTPRVARERVDSSGRVAWVSLTRFVRATVLVALTDAIGVMVIAGILRVPLVLAIGVLVFLGAFVPMIGATLAGTVAVLVALVDQGPLTALFMLLGVILVQQIEGHVLQPFLMGRWVSVHPLGVIIAIGAGVLVAGIPGALVAVPFVAAANAVGQHLASHTSVGDSPEGRLDDEIGRDRPDVPSAAEPDRRTGAGSDG